MRKTRVLVFGVFDLLHPGHVAFLRDAAKHGSELIVVITPDARVKAEKGRTPFFTARERATMVASIKDVSSAVIGDRGTTWTTVKRLRPDVICIGHDQRADHPAFLAQLNSLSKKPRIIRLRAKKASRYASSRIKLEIHRSQS